MNSENIQNTSMIFIRIHRVRNDNDIKDIQSVKFRDSPIIVYDLRHYVEPPFTDSTLPLVWCNNKEKEDKDSSLRCYFCDFWLNDTNGYYSVQRSITQGYSICFHKECIKPKYNLYHPKHSLQVVIYRSLKPNIICCCCNGCETHNFYCSICSFCICRNCVAEPLLLTIDYKKRHEHTLSYFPRKSSMTCDVCGLDERRYFIYVCLQCDFVVHKECIYSLWVIKISRHEHRLSFASSFLPKRWFCGVCRKSVDANYGGYSCIKGCEYVTHLWCALHKHIWDGKELEEEPEEIYEDIFPFKEIDGGIIQHVSHEHQMRLHKDNSKMIRYNKNCHACTFPIHNGDIFSCMECNFVLHKICANLPLKRQHVLHLHLLFLQGGNLFYCSTCCRLSNGFKYMCQTVGCDFELDVNCAAISEPLNHHSHPHLLYLPSKSGSNRFCSICLTHIFTWFECGECEFFLCFRCATLPMKFPYKHDEHALVFSYEQNATGKRWCDACETKVSLKKGIYMCNECDTTLHIECTLGMEMYMLPGKTIILPDGEEMDILSNNHLTRYICKECNKHCQNKIVFKRSNNEICCSMKCRYQTITYESD